MKSRFSVLLNFSLIIFSFLLLTQNACKCNKDASCLCQHGGTCHSDTCACPAGYTGVHCENIDSCYNVTCYNGGTCTGGHCACPTGYEGTNCENKTRDKYVGVWQVSETGTATNAAQFTVSIDTPSSTASLTQVQIKNFYNKYSVPVSASFVGDSLIIPIQTMPNNDVVQGWGIYTSIGSAFGQHAQIVLHFKVTNGSTTDDFGISAGSPAIYNK